MSKAFVEPAYEKVFIRQALFSTGIRLDGRGVLDCREVSIKLSKSETTSTSEVQIGNSIVIAMVSGEIVAPYPDRPTDGILQFNANCMSLPEGTGVVHSELSRLLERAIRESESIDTESLCIIGGEKVWMINCEIKVIDCSGGNINDVCLLAAMSALRAFRKPETSVINEEGNSSAAGCKILIHHSDEREPLPLALHHTPLSVTLGVFKVGPADNQQNKDKPITYIADPTVQEENAMDGKISFSINAHRELCAMNKPGGVALTSANILKAAQIAAQRATVLHQKLALALSELDAQVLIDRQKREDLLRMRHAYQMRVQNANDNSSMSVDEPVGLVTKGGIDRNDPILAWASLHQAAGLWNE